MNSSTLSKSTKNQTLDTSSNSVYKRSFEKAFKSNGALKNSSEMEHPKHNTDPSCIEFQTIDIPGGIGKNASNSLHFTSHSASNESSLNPFSSSALSAISQSTINDNDASMKDFSDSELEQESTKEKLGLWARTLATCVSSALGSVVSSMHSAIQFIDTTYKEQKHDQQLRKRRRISATESISDSDYILRENRNSIQNPTTKSVSFISVSTQPLVASSSVEADLIYPNNKASSEYHKKETKSIIRNSSQVLNSTTLSNTTAKNNGPLFTFKTHNDQKQKKSFSENPFSSNISDTNLVPFNSQITGQQHGADIKQTNMDKKKDEMNRFLEGIKQYRLGKIYRPQASAKSSLTRLQNSIQITKLSPALQLSPNSGAPLMTQVGGGSMLSKPVLDPNPFYSGFANSQTSGFLGNDAQNSTFHKSNFYNGNKFGANQIFASPAVMRAFKFDENRLKKRRPITTYRYAWYNKHPQIELPEQPIDIDLYSQTYLRIVEARDREQAAIDKLREEQEQAARVKQTEVIRPLDEDELELVQDAWSISNPAQKVADAFRVTVTAHDIQTLRYGTWLNDNVIDFYLAMVTERSRQNEDTLPKSFVFTSHFYTKLEKDGFNGVKRWAKRKGLDVTKVDYIFVPVNRNNSHWCLAVINNKDARFEFYDSMNGRGTNTLYNLRDYMTQQTMMTYPESNPDELGYDSYEMLDSVPCPQQQNAYDCGVFTCKMVEVLSREKPLSFTQKDMPIIRQRMTFEIIKQKFSA